MIWLILAGALVLLPWLYLAVLPIGLGINGKVGPYPVNCRVIGSSPFARVVRFLRGKRASDPANGITLLGRIHLWGPASDVLICHEFGHLVRSQGIGHHRYLWRYVTDASFREFEEQMCDDFAQLYHTDGTVILLGERVRGAWG